MSNFAVNLPGIVVSSFVMELLAISCGWTAPFAHRTCQSVTR